MSRWGIIWLLCCWSLNIWAQDFKVQSFSLLESDLTARVDPVYDLNGDACALIKVSYDKGFEFSSPLGIVRRVDRTAEILLYVPAGTKQLTISHPRWGTMRNYALPQVLEGKCTYELVLRPNAWAIEEKQEQVPAIMQDTLIEDPGIDQVSAALPPTEIPFKIPKHYPSYWTFMAQAGIGGVVSTGAMVAYLHRVGVYVSFLSNWNSVEDDGLSCDENGRLYSTGTTPYYTATSRQTSFILDAGATLLLTRGVYLYGGAGYGARNKYWETIEGTQVKNKDLSAEGLALSIGTILCYRNLSAQIGLKSISLKDYLLTIGIGLSL